MWARVCLACCLFSVANAWNVTWFNDSACTTKSPSTVLNPNPVVGSGRVCVPVQWSSSPRFMSQHGCDFDSNNLPLVTGYDNADCTSIESGMGTFAPTAEGQCQRIGTTGSTYAIAYCDLTTTTTTGELLLTTSTTTDMAWGWPWWAWFLFCLACCLILGICGGGAAAAFQPKPKATKAPDVEYYTDYIVEDVDGPAPEDSPLMESRSGQPNTGSAYPYSTGAGTGTGPTGPSSMSGMATGGPSGSTFPTGGPSGGTFPGSNPTATFGGPRV